MDLTNMLSKAKLASFAMMTAPTEQKNSALHAMADALEASAGEIIEANKADMKAARENSMRSAMQDRLALNEKRIYDMAQGLRDIASLPDPIGSGDEITKRPNGLIIVKRRVPLGVVGIIYEARPNVTADAAGICLKSGNVSVLRGGKEAINSNKAIVDVLSRAAYGVGLPLNAINLIEDTTRESSMAMMRANDGIDVLIPRGGAGLIRSVVENASVPVIETGLGNCHVFVEQSADFDKALKILINAKCSRPSVCNAAEKLLISKPIAIDFLKLIAEPLRAKGVEMRGDNFVCDLIPWVTHATPEDWYTEWADYILGIKVVSSFDEAVSHINAHNTKHSDAIVTENYTLAQRFLNEIDAAAVYVNASTRFTDGGEFGLGAEIGISTQKLHARGPMGLREMTSYKYCIYGDGQIR